MSETTTHTRPPRWRRLRLRPTPRTIALCVSGLGALAIGIPTATIDLIRLGAFVLALPALAALTTVLRPPRGAAARAAPHPPLQVGVPSSLTVHVRGSARTLPAADVHDHLPTRRRLHLQHIDANDGGADPSASATTIITPTRRGPLTLGPITFATVDPLGTFRLQGIGCPRATHLVWPRTVAVPFADRLGAKATDLTAEAGFDAHQAWDDATVREYRDGDGMRRIHWRSTARTGTLMVRADAPAATDEITVVVCPPAPEHSEGDREELVSIATSIAVAALDGGSRVSLTTAPNWANRQVVQRFSGPRSRARLLDAAAVLEVGDGLDPAAASALTPPRPTGLVVVVAHGDDPQASALARMRGSRGLAVLVPCATAQGPAPMAVSPALTDAGWHVIVWGRS